MPHADQKYIDAIRLRDERVVTEIYNKCKPDIIWMVYHNSGSVADGEDILHDGFIAMQVNSEREDFKLHCPFGGLLYLICKRKWLNQLRKRKIRGETFLDPEEYKSLGEDIRQIADECILVQAKDDLLTKMIAMLGKKCREVIRLFYWEKRSLREIADLLNTTELSARQKKWKCIEQLRKLMRNDPDFGDLNL